MRDFVTSPLGCIATIISTVAGGVVGFHWLWPLVTHWMLLTAPGTSADNQMGARLLAFPIGVLLGAAIGFATPALVFGAYRFVDSKRNED